MEGDESIDVLGSPEQKAYGSVIAAEEDKNVEDPEVPVGDKISKCNNSFIFGMAYSV